MGLGYFFLFVMIIGSGSLAVILLKTAWKIWSDSKWRALAVLPLLLAIPCGLWAIYIVMIIWREGFYF